MRRLCIYIGLAAAAAVAGVLFLPSGMIRLAVAGVIITPFILIVVDRPRWMFFAALFILLSGIHIFVSFPLLRILSIVIVASLVIAMFKGWRPRMHDRLFTFLVLFFLLFVFQSLAVARDIESSIFRLYIFVTVLLYVLAATQIMRERRDIAVFMGVVVAAFIINDFLPFLIPPPSRYGDTSMIWEQAVYRYEGYVREPNYMAFYQIFFIPLLFFHILVKKHRLVLRFFFLALLLGSIIVLILTFSRGGFVSLVFMLLTLMIVERKNKAVFYTGLAMIVAGAVIAPAVYWERITSLFDLSKSLSQDYAVMSRIATMKTAFILGIRNPFFGVGMENFLARASRYVAYGQVVHNSVLQVFSEIGLPGLLILISIFLYNIRIISSLIGRKNDPEISGLGRILLIQHLAMMFNSMFIPVGFNLVFWLTISLPSIFRSACSGEPESVTRAG